MLRYKETEDIDARFSEVDRVVQAWRTRSASINPQMRREFLTRLRISLIHHDAALEGDVVFAQACLEEVKLTQSTAWYGELLTACIEQARGGDWEAALARWRRGADASPCGGGANAGAKLVERRAAGAAPDGDLQ